MEGLRNFADSILPKNWRATCWSFLASGQKSEQVSTRIPSIESFRVLAIFAVILWHTGFVSGLSQLAGGSFLVVLTGYLVWWVGVPYFFITAGYFFHRSVLAHGNPITHFGRCVFPLAWIFFWWMCIYIMVPPGWPADILRNGLWQPLYSTALQNLHLLATQHVSLFLKGHVPVFHLWFLPALIFSLAVLAFVAICRLERYLIFLIICLFVLAFTEKMIGGFFSNSGLRFGMWLIALLLTAMGWLAAEREQPSAAVAWSLIVSGYAVALIEGMVMNAVFHISLQDLQWHYFLGGIILGAGIFLLALARPKLGESTPLPFLAQFTLGVYVSHILVMYTLSPIIWRLHVPLRGALVGIVVYVLSILLTVVLARVPVVRYLVVKPSQRYQLKA